ncbi:LEF-4 [Betabaculovirus altermyunipunctae]|uniref:LEF-4 n=1 Tax=Betabaculovirus altermyunipunctae TaxID=3051996 RepID=A0A1S5YEE0_9BBAC|nr:LEF-4 [Betabaculovirus altermyunipunctae]AQQ80367.1 LEF-4 [Betabaculovirus altermyunipunctae]
MGDDELSVACDEYELSYTLTLPQDLLYVVKRYLDKEFLVKENYVEIVDVNHVRTRMQAGLYTSVMKRVVDSTKVVVLVGDEFVPMLNRHSVETPTRKCCVDMRRVSRVRVYDIGDGIEVKFEHIYYEYNDGDSLDPLMASKQIALHNILLDEKPIDVTNNSHLGSDEILANCRVELEYEPGGPNQALLYKMAGLIAHVETVVVSERLEPFVQHTSLLNEIVFRPFVDELSPQSVHDNDYAYWAIKLDGVRGRGYVINGDRIHVQLDDMRLYAGRLSQGGVGYNKILSVQVEYLEDLNTFYVTDVLFVYKFLYDNRNHFDKSSPYPVSLQQAVQYLNSHRNASRTFDGGRTLRFQSYHTNREAVEEEKRRLRVPHDGLIAVTRTGELVKVKDHRTLEMLWRGDGKFECSFGVFGVVNSSESLQADQIYEVVIVNDSQVRVVKLRTDRFVPN